MCFPTTSKFLPLSCNSALVLLIGNASWCSWQTSSVIYTYQFIFNQVNCSSFWLPENSPVTRKSFNKILPRMYHLDDCFGCSSGNRMVCNTATYSVPQTLGRVFLAPGREQILLMGPVSPVKHWNLTLTHWLLSVWKQVMFYLFYLFLSTWIPGLDSCVSLRILSLDAEFKSF